MQEKIKSAVPDKFKRKNDSNTYKFIFLKIIAL